ncbi:MAG: PaaI family thioesterase [Anaerolineae bacterium]
MSEQVVSYKQKVKELLDSLPENELRMVLELMEKLKARTGEEGGPFGRFLGVTFSDWKDGHCCCEIEVGDRFWNPHGVTHGAIAFALVDYSMGGALTSLLEPDQRCVTIEIKINYLSAVRRGRLIAETRVTSKGERIAVLESRVKTSSGRPVAQAIGSFYIIKQKRG